MSLFLGAETQWRTAGMSGIPTGLDYGAVSVVAAARGLALDAATMAGLKIMETAALRAFAEMRED